MNKEIKIIDNSNGYKYGKDQVLFNTEKDYGNEYVKVYFRIETNFYHFDNGIIDVELEKEFKKEIKTIFTNLDFEYKEPKYSSSCPEVSKKDGQNLYLHPMNFSGIILKNDIKKISEKLNNAKTFNLRWVDTYETVYVMDDEKYKEYLNNKINEIKEFILQISKTKRVTKFFAIEDIADRTARQFELNRLGIKDGMSNGSGSPYEGFTFNYMLDVINNIIKEGYLVKCEGKEWIRTINKTEQKKLKLYVA